MAEVIAAAIFKGGVGKTTSVLSIGTDLAGRGYKVLFIDLDPQGNLTESLAAPAGHTGSLEVLAKDRTIAECRTNYKAFSLLQSNYALVSVSSVKQAANRLQSALKQVKGEYDFIILDAPPAMNALSLAAITAADHIIIPCQPNSYSYSGLSQFLTIVPASKVLGILITMQRSTNMAAQYKAAIAALAEKNGVKPFKTDIRLCNKVQEAQDQHTALNIYAPTCTAAQDYSQVTDEIIERLHTNRKRV